MKPKLIILTNERDFAADDVIHRIDTDEVDIVRINFDLVQRYPVHDWTAAESTRRTRSTVVWWRQFEIDETVEDLRSADELLVRRAQWRAWLATFDTPYSTWVNPLWSARRAENKPLQLQQALDLGFQVPRTLVTNSRASALQFAAGIKAGIVKTLTSAHYALSDGAFVFTEPLESALDSDDSLWLKQPVIVQERIDAEYDLRIIAFSRHTFGARRLRQELDWRRGEGTAKWEAFAVPHELAALCHNYLRRLDLRFAAFDFLASDDGTWFLEANQGGEWMFIDRSANLGISAALSTFLQRLARQATES